MVLNKNNQITVYIMFYNNIYSPTSFFDIILCTIFYLWLYRLLCRLFLFRNGIICNFFQCSFLLNFPLCFLTYFDTVFLKCSQMFSNQGCHWLFFSLVSKIFLSMILARSLSRNKIQINYLFSKMFIYKFSFCRG